MVRARKFNFFKDINADNPFQNLKYKKMNYEAGKIIINKNDYIHYIGFVIKGFLETINYTYNGERISDGYFLANEIFPEYLYLSGERKYPYTLIALEKSTIAWVEIKEFEMQINNSIEARDALIDYLAKRGLYNQLILACLNYKKVEQRIAYWLLNVKGLEDGDEIYINETQSVLANKLHVCRPSLNQELKNMQKNGYFIFSHNIIKLLNKNGLEKLI